MVFDFWSQVISFEVIFFPIKKVLLEASQQKEEKISQKEFLCVKTIQRKTFRSWVLIHFQF